MSDNDTVARTDRSAPESNPSMPNIKAIRGISVTLDTGVYGSARSLQTLLKHYKNARIDLLLRKNQIKAKELDGLKENFGDSIENVYAMSIPVYQCYLGSRTSRIYRSKVALLAKYVLWAIAIKRIKAACREREYDFVHLNSLGLNGLISRDLPCILHVRELYDGEDSTVLGNIQRAKGVIFIDEVVKRPFANLSLNSIVLENPCDMRPRVDYTPPKKIINFQQKYRRSVVFSMLGSVTEEKGVDFVIRSFNGVREEHTALLIVGEIFDTPFLRKCKALSAHDDRIVFLGREENYDAIKEIYRMTDFVVRAETVPRAGRTILEGLFSGCGVIVPGKESETDANFKTAFGASAFVDMMFGYRTRDVDSLTRLMDKLSKKKIPRHAPKSNVIEYVKEFDRFVRQSIATDANLGNSHS